MADKKNEKKHKPAIIRSFLSLILLLLIAAVGVGYAMKWVTIERTGEKFLIEIDASKVKQGAKQAEEAGEDAAEATGEALKNAGKSLKNVGDQDEELVDEQNVQETEAVNVVQDVKDAAKNGTPDTLDVDVSPNTNPEPPSVEEGAEK